MNTPSADTTHHPEAGSGRTRASRAKSIKVGLAAVLVLLGTFAGLVVTGATPASASTLDGIATLANPSTNGPLDSAGSATDFTAALPPGAACDGDSTGTNGYKVYSYLVPEGTSPTSVTFTTGRPSTGYGLFTNTGYFGPAETAISTGQIINIPNDFQFSELLSRGVTLDDLLYSDGNTSGIWEAGIACAKGGTVADYWNVQVTFAASGTDPDGFVWTAPAVPAAPASPTASSGNASATVKWVAPADHGSSSISAYVITPYTVSSGVYTAKTPIHVGDVTTDDVTGLTNGTTYAFTVTATNSVGTVFASSFSNTVTPATVPGAPTGVTATAGKGSVKLTWKAPSSNGGAAISHYVITPYVGAKAQTAVEVGAVLTDTLTGLTNGTKYTFKVAATNSVGTGAASAASKSVTYVGLYITTKSLPKATKGAKYAAVKLAEKNGVGKLTWSATGLPKGLTVSSAGSLSGTVSSSDAVKTYSVTITVKDSSTPKQTASTKFSLVVAK